VEDESTTASSAYLVLSSEGATNSASHFPSLLTLKGARDDGDMPMGHSFISDR
jgi:hypothetical protein